MVAQERCRRPANLSRHLTREYELDILRERYEYGDRSIATFKWYAGRDMTYRQCHEIAQRIAHTTGELPVECRDYGDIELRLKRDRANVSKSKIDAAIAFEGMANAGRSPAAAEASR
mmetsp:Transcript_17627/g.38327  ORF Transcript_17627/g.38327 Transcript_17627/m.38327 type:complete len:117 (-) Transcript_17627:534-884(-)|eukprot:CAMPEP_0178565086 /NCGR_PEP_ID=MMETSP0697-20121206/13974_1 /TAXON_ID=265572 /ORGANISM="Extubocellulus spinifer, Strain CCMP396" /LENGTH=116 /DNA_ID=CAMNT_0020198669 /DNA_START=151 /DNA_END=501 /DNA_ORIENTATION=-